MYARAAAWDLGLDRMQEKHWRTLEESAPAPAAKPQAAPQQPAPQQAQARRTPPRNAWLGNRAKNWLRR